MAEDEIKSFTSWKLDWVNALMVGVDNREYKVATCLLQHANSKTKLINPSQVRVAKLSKTSVSSVERAISKLTMYGVIETVRKNRQRPNVYRFQEEWKEQMIDHRTQLEDELREGRDRKNRYSDPAKVTGQNRDDPADVQDRDPAKVTGPDPADVRDKHLNGTPEVEHLNKGAGKEGTEVDRGTTREEDTGRTGKERKRESGRTEPTPATSIPEPSSASHARSGGGSAQEAARRALAAQFGDF